MDARTFLLGNGWRNSNLFLRKCNSVNVIHVIFENKIHFFSLLVVNPGTCPSTDGLVGTCVNLCDNDEGCEANQKCCSNGCGRVCMAANLGNTSKLDEG